MIIIEEMIGCAKGQKVKKKRFTLKKRMKMNYIIKNKSKEIQMNRLKQKQNKTI